MIARQSFRDLGIGDRVDLFADTLKLSLDHLDGAFDIRGGEARRLLHGSQPDQNIQRLTAFRIPRRRMPAKLDDFRIARFLVVDATPSLGMSATEAS